MTDERTLLELCRHIVASGEKMGATAVEAQASSTSEVESNIELSQISSVNKKDLDGIAVRAFVGQRMGSAFTNIPTKKAVEEALSLALNAAKASTPDEDWTSLPKPAKYPSIRGLWHDSVADCDSARVVEFAEEYMSRAIEAEPGLIPAYGGSGAGTEHSAYANSNGIEHAERGTTAYVYLAAIAKIESGVTPAIGSYDIRRDLLFNLDWVVEDIVSMIRLCKRTAEGVTGSHTVIFHPDAYQQILYYTLIQSIRGDNVARGKSMIADKIGEAIASELLTIVDDGTIPEGVATSMADDEGVPRRRTSIIEKGVLRSFIWDSYWASKMGVESTGNASRSMRQGQVELSPSTVVIDPGKRDIDDLVSEVKHGYLVRDVQGAHSSNPESGDFSIVGNPAILIEDGEMKGAVHGLMVSGNVFDLLKQVVDVAKKPLVLQGLIGPEIVCEDMKVIARD